MPRRSIHWSGSGFHIHEINGSRPMTRLLDRDDRQLTNYVLLGEWCAQNFITKKIGYGLIKRKLLIAQRFYGRWYVCANLGCLEQLLEYLGIEQLFFDANN